MDFFIELIAEIVIEAFGEFFVWVSQGFFPESGPSPKARKVIEVLCALLGLAMMIALVAGVLLLIDPAGDRLLGLILTSVSVGYMVIGLCLSICRRKRKKD